MLEYGWIVVLTGLMLTVILNWLIVCDIRALRIMLEQDRQAKQKAVHFDLTAGKDWNLYAPIDAVARQHRES